MTRLVGWQQKLRSLYNTRRDKARWMATKTEITVQYDTRRDKARWMATRTVLTTVQIRAVTRPVGWQQEPSLQLYKYAP